jgi:multidrug efflux system outer membrane protein
LPGEGEHARIRATEAGADAALARFDGVVLNALRETETSLAVYAHELDRNAALRRRRSDEAATGRGQAQTLYRFGRQEPLPDRPGRPAHPGHGGGVSLAASDGALAALTR